jgi:hypothetical protein
LRGIDLQSTALMLLYLFRGEGAFPWLQYRQSVLFARFLYVEPVKIKLTPNYYEDLFNGLPKEFYALHDYALKLEAGVVPKYGYFEDEFLNEWFKRTTKDTINWRPDRFILEYIHPELKHVQ